MRSIETPSGSGTIDIVDIEAVSVFAIGGMSVIGFAGSESGMPFMPGIGFIGIAVPVSALDFVDMVSRIADEPLLFIALIVSRIGICIFMALAGGAERAALVSRADRGVDGFVAVAFFDVSAICMDDILPDADVVDLRVGAPFGFVGALLLPIPGIAAIARPTESARAVESRGCCAACCAESVAPFSTLAARAIAAMNAAGPTRVVSVLRNIVHPNW